MTAPDHLPDDVATVWRELAGGLPGSKLGPEFEAYCGTVARLRDAQRRIAAEGAIVPDGKQNPVPHPALAIERSALQELRKWGSRFTPRKGTR